MDKVEFKRYAISSLYTFLAGFFTSVIAALSTTDMTTFKMGTALTIFLVGMRGGVKVLGEAFIIWKSKKKKMSEP